MADDTTTDSTQAAGGRTTRDVIVRAVYALLGCVLIGLGAALLQVGGVGVDPYTAMNIGISDRIGWDLGAYQLLSNLVLFIPVLIWGRRYFGVGTVINMVLVGFFIQFFFGWLDPVVPDDLSVGQTALFFLAGILVFDFGASAYISANVGTAPYDAIAPMIVDARGWEYQRVRVPQDLVVLGIAVLFAGPVGVGTVMTAFFNGPLIQFFNDNVNRALVAKVVRDLTSDSDDEPVDRPGTPGDPTKLVGRRRTG